MPTTTGTLLSRSAGQWRLLNALHTRERRADPRGPSLDASRTLDRNDVSRDELLALWRAGYVACTIGTDWVDFHLENVTWPIKQSRSRGQRLRLAITKSGGDLARDPWNLVLTSLGRRHRYLVRDVASCAEVPGSDVNRVLKDMEEADLLKAFNDQGVVELKMFQKAQIPPQLRLRLTVRGGTYLARKA